MKKSFTILFMLIVTSTTFAQKCKYERNEVSQETKLHVKVTKEIAVYSNFNTTGGLRFSNFGKSFSLEFCHAFSFSGCATTYEGCEITFLLANGESITLTKGKMDYGISQKQIQTMLESKIIKIRYQYGDNPSNSKFIENDVKSKNADAIIELIKCVL